MDNINDNPRIFIGLSSCVQTYLMNCILFQKQEPIKKVQNLKINFLKSKLKEDETQPVEMYENSIVVFEDMLPSKEANNFDLFFNKRRHSTIDKDYISQG